MMREKCGVIAAYSLDGHDVAPFLLRGLENLQHRGQESWGVAVFGHEPYKRLGLVMDRVDGNLRRAKGQVGIGHVRYSTKGKTNLVNAHPIKIGSLLIAHNGTIENVEELALKVSQTYSIPTSATDTELMGLRLTQIFSQKGDWGSSFEALGKEVNGSYSLVILTNRGELLAARDERGFRPLSMGYHKDTNSYIIASESCALHALGATSIRDVGPGELIRVDEKGLSNYRFSDVENHAHCPFEYTYFAHPGSYLEGINVYMARRRIGRELAMKYPIDGDLVIPVPDSARPAALGYSEGSGILFEEGLMKDRYRKRGGLRSFIEPIQRRRAQIVKQVSAVRATVSDKNVIVVDDSIVRGTSLSIIAKILKEAGAKSISLVVTFPPIRYPCYAGIDFPTQEELIAYRACGDVHDLEAINKTVASALGVRFVGYNDVEGLAHGIGIPIGELCLSCTTGDYSCLRSRPRFRTRKEMKG